MRLIRTTYLAQENVLPTRDAGVANSVMFGQDLSISVVDLLVLALVSLVLLSILVSIIIS